MRIKHLSFLAMALFAFALPAKAATDEMNLRFTIAQWVNLVEVYAGTKELQKGKDADVVAFAKASLETHVARFRSLATFAREKAIVAVKIQDRSEDLAKELVSLIDETSSLKDLEGTELDKAYVALILKAQDLSIRNLELADKEFGQTDEGKFLVAFLDQVKEARDKLAALRDKL